MNVIQFTKLLVILSTINDSVKAWNNAPNELKTTTTIHGAKAAIKKFVKTIPIRFDYLKMYVYSFEYLTCIFH